MASVTSNALVLAEQRKSCADMIEIGAGFRLGELFPSGRRVAGLATRLEGAVVRIGVAVGAVCERNARESGYLRIGRFGPVAFLALHLDVRARQRIARFRMIEP